MDKESVSTYELPERRTLMAERLTRVETELKHLVANTDKLVNAFDISILDSQKLHTTVIELVGNVHQQSSSLTDLKSDLRSMRTELAAKANIDRLITLEKVVEGHAKTIGQAATVLKTIEWTMKIGGPAVVGGILYWFFTGELPGGG